MTAPNAEPELYGTGDEVIHRESGVSMRVASRVPGSEDVWCEWNDIAGHHEQKYHPSQLDRAPEVQ